MRSILETKLLFLSLLVFKIAASQIPNEEDRKFLENPLHAVFIKLDEHKEDCDLMCIYRGIKPYGDMLFIICENDLIKIDLPKALRGKHLCFRNKTSRTVFVYAEKNPKKVFAYNYPEKRWMAQKEIRGHDNEGPM